MIARRSYRTAKNSGVNSPTANHPNDIQTINFNEEGRQVQLDDINFEVDREDDNDILDTLLSTDYQDEMMTNDARINEALAILLLEIMGSIFALMVGTLSHIEYFWNAGSFGS